jgi:hypothetical protein
MLPEETETSFISRISLPNKHAINDYLSLVKVSLLGRHSVKIYSQKVI